jgi:Family of unknown function (DUF5681)
MPFVKGQSGNPAGRPIGSRNRFTSEMQEAFEESGLPVIQKLLQLAGEGNTGAMRLFLDRLMGKHRASSVALPSADSPNYVLDALNEIHRALGAGEIPSDEASRLVDFVGRTARVLASKAVAELDFDERLARCEEALALNGGKHVGQEATASEPAPQPAAEAAIDNNNAETMAPPPEEAAPPVAAIPAEPVVIENNNGNTIEAAALDEAVRATVPRRDISVREQLMNSTSHLALTAGADPGNFTRVTPQPAPLASAA